MKFIKMRKYEETSEHEHWLHKVPSYLSKCSFRTCVRLKCCLAWDVHRVGSDDLKGFISYRIPSEQGKLSNTERLCMKYTHEGKSMLAMENKMRFMETCTIYICAPPRNGKKGKRKIKSCNWFWVKVLICCVNRISLKNFHIFSLH